MIKLVNQFKFMPNTIYVADCPQLVRRSPGISANFSRTTENANHDHHMCPLLCGWFPIAHLIDVRELRERNDYVEDNSLILLANSTQQWRTPNSRTANNWDKLPRLLARVALVHGDSRHHRHLVTSSTTNRKLLNVVFALHDQVY